MVPAHSTRVSRVPVYSGSCRAASPFAYGAFTLSGRVSQTRSARFRFAYGSPNPTAPGAVVWALPRSLAATYGIDVSFFSSGYLDVSVHRVPLLCAIYSRMDAWVLPMRVSSFRNPRVTGYVLLTAAFRSLSRLSSALSAKASTLCSFMLDLATSVAVSSLAGGGNLFPSACLAMKRLRDSAS